MTDLLVEGRADTFEECWKDFAVAGFFMALYEMECTINSGGRKSTDGSM